MAVSCGVAILASGCSTLHKSDLSALQGTWKGHVINDQTDSPCSFVISGNDFDFHDANNIWYKGSFSLREEMTPRQYIAVISACSFPQYVGKTGMAIYRIDGNALTLAGNEPGNPAAPATFTDPEAARLELTKSQ